MAFTNSDGSIILSTKVDTKGLSSGFSAIKSLFGNVTNAASQMGQKIRDASESFKTASANLKQQKADYQLLTQAIKDQQFVIKNLEVEYAQLVARGKQNSDEAKNLKGRIDDLNSELKELETAANTLGDKGTPKVNTFGTALKRLASYLIGLQTIFKLINFSSDASAFAAQTEASVQRLVDIYGSASKSVGDFIDANASAIGMSKAAATQFASAYGNIFSTFANQAQNAELTNEYLQMTAVIANKTGRSVEEVQEKIKSGLFGNLRAIDDLGIFVRQSALEASEAFKEIANGRQWDELTNEEQQQIRAFAILEQGVSKYGDTIMQTAATTRAQFQAAYEDFKNTWGQIINQVLIPVLQIATEVLRVITKGLQAIAQIGGATISEAQASAIGEAAENQNDLTKAVEETAKAQERSLASFDKVNKLSESSSESLSSSGAGATAGGGLGVSGTQPKMTSYAPQINKDLAELMSQIALALVAVGLILLLFGQIGWGIGFIIAGAFVFTVSQQAVSEGAIGQKIDSFLKENATLIAGLSVAFIVFGVILLLAGQITPLSIGLIAFGAIGLVKEYMLNRTAIKAYLNNFFKENQKTFYKVGLAMCVLGIICLFTGVGIPLGIGLLLAGGASLAAAISPNWGFIKEKLKEVWEGIKQFWNRHIAPIFTLTWWKNLGITIINGLIAGLEGGINLIIGGFEDMINLIVDGLNNLLSFELPDFLGGGGFSLDLPRADFPRVSLPRLARGAVIPPNKEFLAILGDQKHGTNIEAPLETIKQAVAEVVGGNGGKQPAIVNVYISSKRGLRLISQEVIADINETIATTGRVPINI